HSRSDHQQREKNQIVKHAIAYCFAKGIAGDVNDTSAHCPTPAARGEFAGCFRLVSEDPSCSMKYCSRVMRTGVTETRRACSRRNRSRARSSEDSGRTARTVSPVMRHSLESEEIAAIRGPCHVSSTLLLALAVSALTAPTARSWPLCSTATRSHSDSASERM